MLNEEFDLHLNPLKLAAWKALKTVVASFLGNHRHDFRLGPVKVIKLIFFLVVQKAVKPIIIQKLLCYGVY